MKTNYLNEILLRRRNKVVVVVPISEIDNLGRVMVMMKQVQALGFTFSKELIEQLRYCNKDVLDAIYLELIGYLKSYVGADRTYNFMYPSYPQQVVEASDLELFVNAIIHYWSYGTLLPNYEKDERLPLFESTDLTVLDIGTTDDMVEVMNNLLGSKTSLSQQDKNDLVALLKEKSMNCTTVTEIPFKENVPIISKLILDNTANLYWFNSLKLYYKTATDVLRFAIYLSDGDVSLATPTKFKSMPRKVRKLFVQLLDNCGNIEEDMLRHEMAWIRLGEFLHVSEPRYRQYTKVQTAFDKLRNNGKIETFGGNVDKAIRENRIGNAINLLKNRPGELARMLDFLIRNHKDKAADIISAFSGVASQVSVPVLLQVKEHFAWRNEQSDTRVFFPKGNLAKAYTIKNELEPISAPTCTSIVGICEVAIIEQFKTKTPMGKVYIADSMKGYCVPQSQRSANSAMKIITRGSRFKLKDNAQFIRLGIHWMNEMRDKYEDRTDIDLSCSFLDKNFSNMDHISYTHLRNSYSVHSGDLTSAPRHSGGSAECIDIYIDKALRAGVRYAAVQVYGFTHTKFCDLDDMLFNWQEGEDANVGDIFEPARVQQCMNLGGDTGCEIPVIFDLEKREVIWCDLTLTTHTSFPRCVEGNVRGVSAMVMGIVQAHKPTMSNLATLNALARGSIVYKRNEADVIFDTDTTPVIETITKYIEVQNEKGEVVETRTETEERVKDCKFITPWDIDLWMSDLL